VRRQLYDDAAFVGRGDGAGDRRAWRDVGIRQLLVVHHRRLEAHHQQAIHRPAPDHACPHHLAYFEHLRTTRSQCLSVCLTAWPTLTTCAPRSRRAKESCRALGMVHQVTGGANCRAKMTEMRILLWPSNRDHTSYSACPIGQLCPYGADSRANGQMGDHGEPEAIHDLHLPLFPSSSMRTLLRQRGRRGNDVFHPGPHTHPAPPPYELLVSHVGLRGVKHTFSAFSTRESLRLEMCA
jgi:hypothetical protein